jgi:hypothetical protein
VQAQKSEIKILSTEVTPATGGTPGEKKTAKTLKICKEKGTSQRAKDDNIATAETSATSATAEQTVIAETIALALAATA